MCGIVGIWGNLPEKRPIVEQGCGRMRHRGPDSQGYWEDAQAGVALGHVRLAILDLSPAGHQPMISACGRYVLILNGEIYNHQELRAQLEAQGRAPAWRGHSDTETVLAAFAAWGIAASLAGMTGMFAIALWDRQERCLSLMRDRMGEKPLYMGYADGNFVFGSELKAMTAIPGFDGRIDRRALSLLLRHNYIPAPYSIYRSIGKLPPGQWLTLTEADLRSRSLPSGTVYWSAADVSAAARGNMLSFDSDSAAADALEEVLSTAVGRQMISDVELGAFLSGGIDSSTIVALMQKRSSQPVRTFAIGFDDPAYNEAQHAKEVARHLGTTHTEMYVSAADALSIVPQLPTMYDEPFADSSQVPTALVMRMARRHVTVALSGDGGDELFSGYSRYFRAAGWWHKRQRLPQFTHGVLAAAAGSAAALMPAGRRRDRFEKLSEVLAADSQGVFYRQFVSYWKDPAQAVIGAELPETCFDDRIGDGLHETMSLLDILSYLPDDILVKVDRAAMAVGLETRVPMLDHQVVEFSRRLPLSYRIRSGQGKWLLRQVLYRHVPQALVDRPKKGFSVPLASWLRGPLNEWANALLDPARLNQEGLFHAEPILRKWREHQQNKQDWSTHLWSILMTQAWLDSVRAADVRPS
ncbi:asparagine synthase (glutamine-hydrolyzing) [Parapusillimonas sp. JC17]|uniref:asparagine synthase (glutamine-hydrolyzing) n=1 Tax=Parapusillimonas sp. JC17 TaxID=3445768 RepID=UPI003FA09DA6